MATDIERLTISLEANLRKYEREMARSRSVTSDALNKIEREVTSRGGSISNAFGGLAKRASAALAGIGAGLSLNEFRKTADEYTRIVNGLKVAGVSGGALPGVLDQLFASAQRNAVPLESLAQLYGRVSQAQTTLKATSSDLIGLTDIVAQSLRVGGTSATEASGALLQLGQALSGGKIQAEEYNSLIDGLYPLLQTAASGLKEAGGDVAKLTALVKDGKVSSEAFFRAIQAGAPTLGEKLSGSVSTSEQALTRMRNEFVRVVGQFNETTGVSKGVIVALDGITGGINVTGQAAASAVLQIQGMIKALAELGTTSGTAITNALAKAQEGTANTQRAILEAKLRGAIGPERKGIEEQLRALDRGPQNPSSRAAQDAADRERFIQAGRDAGDFGNIGTGIGMRGVPQPPSRPAGIGGPKLNPVSLKDFPVPGAKDGAGGGGGSSKEKLDAYDKEIKALEKRTEALRLEATTVGKGTYEIERSKAAHDLERAAKEANIPVTDELRQKIAQASEGYASAKVNVENVTKALDATRDAQKFFGESVAGVFSDMISGGENAEKAIMNLTKKLAEAALQAALIGTGPIGGISGVTDRSTT